MPLQVVLNVVNFCRTSPAYKSQLQRAVGLGDHLAPAHPTGEELPEHHCRAEDGEQAHLLEEDGLLEADCPSWLLTEKRC